MLSTKPIPASKQDKVEIVKKDIHPTNHPVCFSDVSTGRKFITRSTAKSKNSESLDGIDHFLHVRDVTMDSHPAYTGEKRFVDTAGRVEKFNKKYKK